MNRKSKIKIVKTLIYSSIYIFTIMNVAAQSNLDNSDKCISARAFDPQAAVNFAKIVPALIGNAEYVPTTNDADFIKQLKSREWSVVFFAPGACRLIAAKRQIPGGNYDTRGWTLEQYKELVRELQSHQIQIVETLDERDTIGLLKAALEKAGEKN